MSEIIKEYTEHGIKITEYSDGSTIFKAIDMKPRNGIDKVDNRSWWQKFKDWWNTTSVKPYVRIKDLSDPTGELKKNSHVHDGSGSQVAGEIGIKISF